MKAQVEENRTFNGPSKELDVCRFGVFELDMHALELWRRGRRCRLAPQPARVLVHLVRCAGRLVTREELAQAVWGEGIHVDAEAGLNAAIRQVRQALDDDAASPRFVETLPRRGYRFIAPVAAQVPSQTVPTTDAAPRPAPHAEHIDNTAPSWPSRSAGAATWLGVAAFVSMLALAGAGWRGVRSGDGDGRGHDGPASQDGAASVVGEATRQGSPDAAAEPQPPPAAAIAPPALDAYFKGRYILRNGGAQSGARAAALFARALEIDPGAVPALAGLASARLRMTVEGALDPATGLAMAFDEADRAVAADPRLAEGWRVRARARWLGQWDWQGADADFAQAIAADPGTATSHIAHAFFRSAAGDHEGALAAMAHAARLDPLSPAVNLDSAWLFFFARRYEEAITRATRALELDPTLFSAHYCLSASYERLGRPAEASRHALAMTTSAGGDAAGTDRDAMLGWWRQQAEADAQAFPHYDRALLALGQGDAEQALDSLEISLERREAQITRLGVDPRLGGLADQARFQALLARLGGPDPLGIRAGAPALAPAEIDRAPVQSAS